jgi:tape measure domain-containing protein
MSGKNLTFKLVMEGDNKSLVASAKQSQEVTQKLFDSIKKEAEQVKKTSQDASKAIEGFGSSETKQKVAQLVTELHGASQALDGLGKDANLSAENLKHIGDYGEASLNKLQVDLEKARQNLNYLSATNATPANINEAQQEVKELEQGVKQVKIAFDAYSNAANASISAINSVGGESAKAAEQVKKLDTELNQANAELAKTDSVAVEATKGIQGLKTGYTALTSAMAALGIGVTASELSKQADAYKNLTARIQIAIGEHGNIEKAMDDVIAVSLKTNANLEATGGLYGRLTKIGQEMKWPQEQALALTEAINKAVAVGGGSAQANEAALTQLNQALGSGVLRGDEFNSIMEQSPRLAQAMADGLKVNTGELRNMAGEGKLTADVVTKAILSQSDAITKEFAKFPTTIGNSIENLKTSWMIYLGELDKTHGVSERAANAIKYLAENLDEVMGMLTLAGQAFITYKALNIASIFLDKAAGVRAASIALTQETAVVVANTQAQLANATATRSASLAKTQLATNAQTASLATASTSGSIMTLVGRLGALGIAVTALGILVPTVIEPLGTAIGEGVAKLMGYGDAIEKYDRQLANEAARTKAAAEIKASFALASEKATEKTYQLTKESKKLIEAFDALIKKGEDSSDSLDKVSESMRFDSTKNINDSITAFVALQEQGKITAEQIQQNLSKALDGKDLIVFETNAKAAFMGTAKEVEKLALVTEAVLNQALFRTGLTYEQLQGKGSLASNSLINDSVKLIDSLESLKAKGIDVGIALNTSLGKAISGAETADQVEILKSKITSLRSELGVTVSNGLLQQAEYQLLKIQGLSDEAKAGINSVAEAFNKFGIQTKQEANLAADGWVEAYKKLQYGGVATTNQLRQAIQKMTSDIYASGDAGKISWLENQMYMHGMTESIDEFGRASSVLKTTDDAISKIGHSAKETAAQLDQMNKAQVGEIKDNSWEDFKSKRKISENNRTNTKVFTPRVDTANSISELSTKAVVELAPLITTAFTAEATENIQPKETKRLELSINGQTSELEGTPENVDLVDQLFSQLERDQKRR